MEIKIGHIVPKGADLDKTNSGDLDQTNSGDLDQTSSGDLDQIRQTVEI